MEQEFITDSNVAIDFLSGKLPKSGMEFMNTVVNSFPVLSVITKIEMLGYNASDNDAALLSDFIKTSIVLELSNEIVNKTIAIRKKHKIKIPDAIIAATALVYDLTLITHNTNDFSPITRNGLRITDAWKV